MNSFKSNLRHYRKLNNLKQKELGDLLGIGQTAIANYESGTRTPSINVLVALAESLNITIDQLLLESPIPEKKQLNTDICNDIKKAMLDKDEHRAFLLFRQLKPNKSNLNFIFEDIITPIMIDIGSLWDQGIISITDEHYITNLMSRIIDMLSIHGLETPKNGRKAICMTVASDQHTLGIKMISIYLELLGFQSIYIGNNLPTRSIIQLLKEETPHLFLISITMPFHINSVNDLIDNIENALGPNHPPILIGGQGIHSLDNLSESNSKNKMNYIRNIDELKRWLMKHKII